MTLAFLQLPPAERQLYIAEAAARRGLSPVVLEKDFWVCWLLGIVFKSSFRDAIVFKGGTSLSKVFGVINRFSEDIDLSLVPAFVGLDEPDAAAGLSRGQANKWMARAEAACTIAVRDTLAPEIAAAVEANLGEHTEAWLTFEVDAGSHSPILLFHYPTTQPPALEYLKRSVKLEFGSLTDQRPTGSHAVRPWIADVLPGAGTIRADSRDPERCRTAGQRSGRSRGAIAAPPVAHRLFLCSNGFLDGETAVSNVRHACL